MLKKIFQIIIYIFAIIGFILMAGYVAIRLHLTNVPGIIQNDQDRYLVSPSASTPVDTSWAGVPEWQTFAAAIIKDKPILLRVQSETGVSARLIMAMTASEQLRLFYDDRESYKQFFQPLQILGSESQFSWGVTGIKDQTAEAVENNLKDPTSAFYPGTQYTHLLDFDTATTTDIGTQRFNRIIDQHNHYWSYLYAALYIKEVEMQWKKAGFDISNNIGVLATLYNVGFEHSMPKAAPQVGGAAIPIGAETFSFGALSYDIYYSNELLDSFPR